MDDGKYCVYILTNRDNKVLYIGFTGNLKERIYQHKTGLVKGFTEKYNVNRLVYFEHFNNIDDAKRREKAMKKWRRSWKEELISKSNPSWAEVLIH